MRAMPEFVTDSRLHQAEQWARQTLGEQTLSLLPISGDASFRRYFRIQRPDGMQSMVLMDAPPQEEDSRPFLDVAKRLRQAGLRAPEILHFDLELGFGIIEDFGDRLYRAVIDDQTAPVIFPDLFDLLARMARNVSYEGLPPYNETLLQEELNLFPDWYLGRHRQRLLSATERATWLSLCRSLIDNAKAQPQVFVHKDFHSCNLLYEKGKAPAIIDFQDAVRGPVSYDFISLIWDRYIHWPRSQIEAWMAEMHSRLGLACTPAEWVRYCDLMGLQRNIKVVGIFARLHHRDDKDGYINMIPMFYRYLLDVLPRYSEFSAFKSMLGDRTCAP
jgi:aminoglycoside/choline kinase family phosphotransferase